MDEPGGQRAQDGSDHILVLHAFKGGDEGGRGAQRIGGKRQQPERQQHQAEADGDAAEMVRLCPARSTGR